MKPTGHIGTFYRSMKSLPERVAIVVLGILGSWRTMETRTKRGEKKLVSLWTIPYPFKYVVHTRNFFKKMDPHLQY